MALIEYKAPFWCRPHSSSGELSSVQEVSSLNILLCKGIVPTLIIIRVGLETYNHDAETVVTVQSAEMKQSSIPVLDSVFGTVGVGPATELPTAFDDTAQTSSCISINSALYNWTRPFLHAHRHGQRLQIHPPANMYNNFSKSWTQHVKPVL